MAERHAPALRFGPSGRRTLLFLVVVLVGTGFFSAASAASVLAALGATQGAAAVFLLRRGRQGQQPWIYAGLSACCSASTFLVLLVYEVQALASPRPSLADVGFFGAAVFMVLAILTFPQRQAAGGGRLRLVLDGSIVAISVWLLAWVWFVPTLDGVAGATGTALVAAIYPAVDVAVLLMAVLTLRRVDHGAHRPLLAVCVGLALLACGDVSWAYVQLNDSSIAEVRPILWATGYWVMVGARDIEVPQRASDSSRLSVMEIAVPMVPAAAALPVTLFQDTTLPVLAPAVLLVVLLLTRLTVALVAESRLRTNLEAQILQRTRQLTHHVFHDFLTGLGNRALLNEHLEGDFARAHRGRERVALLLLDLDGFRGVNDTRGHLVGDEVLIEVAARLRELAPPSATVARLGGDEFALIIPAADEVAVTTLADAIVTTVALPVTSCGTGPVTASIGVAWSAEASSPMEMLRNADLAMYDAKTRGGSRWSTFEPSMHALLLERTELEADLLRAVLNDELVLHYQPVVSVATGRVDGVEALARWDHPVRGLVPPDVFIPAAERVAMISTLGMWVLDEACRQAAAWRREPGLDHLTMAVNASVDELDADTYHDVVLGVLALHGLPAGALVIEVTESKLMTRRVAQEQLERLRASGIGIAIDDFGTGQSSLSRLQHLPVDVLKIDRSFVQQIQTLQIGNPLMATIIAMAHALGLTVVAEGVETDEQLDTLRRLGCEQVQGYLLSKPLPAGVLRGSLTVRRLTPATVHSQIEQPQVEAHLQRSVEGIVTRSPSSVELIPLVLEELQRLTGLDSTYLTRIDWEDEQQVITHVNNVGPLQMEEDLSVEWSDTLCRRALSSGHTYTSDAAQTFSDTTTPVDFGIRTYVSVPVRLSSGAIYGTICGISAEPVEIPDAVLTIMQIFANTVASRISMPPSGDQRRATLQSGTEPHRADVPKTGPARDGRL